MAGGGRLARRFARTQAVLLETTAEARESAPVAEVALLFRSGHCQNNIIICSNGNIE